jgi:predicted secreted protein
MKKVVLIMILLIISIFLSFNTTLSTVLNIDTPIKTSSQYTDIPYEAWNKTFGGTALDWGWSVQETTDNGFIIAGETVSFGSGGYDAWLIKTDNNGNEIWNKTFGGLVKDGVRSIQQTSDNGYIIGGYADSYGYPGHDVWLIKTDDEGNEEWDSIFGGLASDAAFSVIQTSDQGYIALGYVDSYGAGSHDIWLIKTDLFGNEEWNRTFGTFEWDLGYSVQETNDGDFIIIGTTKSYGSGGQDAWLIKTDEFGNEVWNKTYGGANNDWGSSVVMTDDGGFLLTGDTRSYGPGGYDIWIIKTDKYGNEQWRRIYGDSESDDTGYSLKKTSDGGYIITGTKTSFDTDLTDVWLIKTDVDGYMQWNLTIDGGFDDWSYSVDETNDGGYIITGLTNSFGSGDYDLWLIKVEVENDENQPPNVPEITGPQNGDAGVEYEYIFVSEDNDGDEIFYLIDWDDNTTSEWLGPYQSGLQVEKSHTWSEQGIYNIRAKVKDIHGAESDWSDSYIVVIGNHPPDKPIIKGPTCGKPNTEYDFTFVSTDPEGDAVMYNVDWGDGNTEWTEYGDSGVEFKLKHTWEDSGKFTIKAQAIDFHDAESEWADFVVTMPRDKTVNRPLIQLLENYLKSFLLLQKLLFQIVL